MTPLDKHVGVIGNGLIFMTEFTATQALDDALIKIDNLCEDTGLLCWLTDDEQSALKQLWKAIDSMGETTYCDGSCVTGGQR